MFFKLQFLPPTPPAPQDGPTVVIAGNPAPTMTTRPPSLSERTKGDRTLSVTEEFSTSIAVAGTLAHYGNSHPSIHE